MPGAVSAWVTLSQRFGKLPFADLLAPAIETAERGYAVPVIVQQKWANAAALPEELVFRVNYLGGDMPTFTLNFSRPGNQVVGQYYNFLRLGREGYTSVMRCLSETAQ